MTRILLTISLFFTLFDAFGSQVESGLFTDNITIWRYWERIDNGYKYKMIVFNTGDSTIALTLQQEVFIGSQMRCDTTKRKVFFKNLLIEKDKHIIIEIPPQTENQEFFALIVDNKVVGRLELDKVNPPKDLPIKKYCSNEGLNGSGGQFWISKQNLINTGATTDSLFLYFNYNERPIYVGDGIHLIVMRPNQALKSFSVTSHNKPIGEFNFKGEYILELPCFADYDRKKNEFLKSNEKIDVLITYQIKKTTKLFLGLNAASGVNTLKDGQTLKELRKKMYPTGGCEMPVMAE